VIGGKKNLQYICGERGQGKRNKIKHDLSEVVINFDVFALGQKGFYGGSHNMISCAALVVKTSKRAIKSKK
jgi:hypothetical protein